MSDAQTEAVNSIMLHMFNKKPPSEIVCFGDKRKVAAAQKEYEDGARCFMLKSPLALLHRVQRAPVIVRRKTLIEKLREKIA